MNTLKSEDLITAESSPARSTGEDHAEKLRRVVSTKIVTTSWDDGSPFALGVAALLAERKLSGTFYVPVKGHDRPRRMGREEMRLLDRQGFEIGAHGVSHPNLAQCEPQRLASEVEVSKKRLEDDLGKEVVMFAYPRGRYNNHVIAAVKQAGFAGARTTAMLACELTFDPFRMPTSLHAFPHLRRDYMRNLARVLGWRRTWVYVTHLRCASNWTILAKFLFDSVLRDGGIWHIYGHSWEIEESNLWADLREVLDYISNRPGVLYLPNSAVVDLGKGKFDAASVTPA